MSPPQRAQPGLEPTHHGVVGGLHDVDPSQSRPRAAEVRANASPWGVISHLPELKPHLAPHGGAQRGGDAQCQPSAPVQAGQQPHAPHVGPGEQHRGAWSPPSVHDGVVEAGPGENHKCLTQGVFIWD